MNSSFLPTYKAWLWLFRKPTLSQEDLVELHSIANRENYWRRIVAGGLWVLFCLFFICIGILICILIVGIFYEQGNPLNCLWLKPGGSPIILIVGIALNIVGIVISASVATVFWTYVMRSSGFINNAAIEMIIRNGPLLSKIHTTKNKN